MPTRPQVHRPPRSQVAVRAKPSAEYHHLYGWAWQKASKAFLEENPLCAACGKEGRVVAAKVVDHVAPHKGDVEAFWRGPWQSLCVYHHNVKTAKEGGFGRPPATRDEGK